MESKLTSKESEFTKKMLAWDQKKAPLEEIINALFLIGAGVAIVVAVILTAKNFGNQFILWEILPGYAIGILLLCNFIVGDLRIKERRRYATIFRKILSDK